MQKAKKILASVLAISMLLSMLTVGAFAAEDVGEPYQNPYTDVAEKDWFSEEVQYVTENDLMKGTTTSQFSPNMNTSRAMVVTTLYRLDGEPQVTLEEEPFTDLTQEWYITAVKWAYVMGIVKGRGGGVFCPNDDVTRQELVTMLQRYVSAKKLNTSRMADLSAFVDAGEMADFATEAMAWAVDVGLVTGRTETTLAPLAQANRAELAALLYRLREDVIPNAEDEELGENDTPLVDRPDLPSGHTHVALPQWHSDGTRHWQNCRCGVAMNLGNHTYGNYVIYKGETVHHQICTACSYDLETEHALDHYQDKQNGTHALVCVCGTEYAVEAHDYVEGVCSKCGAEQSDEDPIAIAIAASMKQVNELDKPYLDISGSGEQLGGLKITLSAQATGASRDATVTADVEAETAEDLTDSVLAVATIYAYKVLGLGELPEDENAAFEELKEILKPILDEMGITSWEGKRDLIRKVIAALKSDVKGEAKNIWANFHDSDGYLFETAVISCEGTDIATVSTAGGKVTVNGGRSLDTISGKKLAVKTIAKALLASVKEENPTASSTLKAAVELKVKYTGGKAVLADGTNPDSTLICDMNVKSGMFSYYYNNGKHNLTVNMPTVKEWIGQTMADKVSDALTNENTMKAIVDKVQGEHITVTKTESVPVMGSLSATVTATATPTLSQLSRGANIPLTINSLVFNGNSFTELSGLTATLTINSIQANGQSYQNASDLLIKNAKGILDGSVDPELGVTVTINGSIPMQPSGSLGFNNVTATTTAAVGEMIQAALQAKKNDAALKDGLKNYCENSSDMALKLAAKVPAALDYAIECALGTPTDAQRDAAVAGLMEKCTIGQAIDYLQSHSTNSNVAKIVDLFNKVANHTNLGVDGVRALTVQNLMDGVDVVLTYNSFTEPVFLKLNLG